eukprot:scaffold61257_cov34-Tisochrysis_lutea.AAC.6
MRYSCTSASAGSRSKKSSTCAHEIVALGSLTRAGRLLLAYMPTSRVREYNPRVSQRGRKPAAEGRQASSPAAASWRGSLCRGHVVL